MTPLFVLFCICSIENFKAICGLNYWHGSDHAYSLLRIQMVFLKVPSHPIPYKPSFFSRYNQTGLRTNAQKTRLWSRYFVLRVYPDPDPEPAILNVVVIDVAVVYAKRHGNGYPRFWRMSSLSNWNTRLCSRINLQVFTTSDRPLNPIDLQNKNRRSNFVDICWVERAKSIFIFFQKPFFHPI